MKETNYVKTMKWLSVVAAVFFAGAPLVEAEAKRLGGGLSFGRMAPAPGAKPQAVPPRQAQPAAAPQQGQQAARPAQQQQPAAAQSAARSSWMGPLAGIAAGLGLAALASYLGIGEELMSLMLIALAVFAAIAIFRMVSGSRRAPAGSFRQPVMARSGYGNTDLGPEGQPANVSWPASGYSRPAEPVLAPSLPTALVSQTEIDQFVSVAREQFTKLQSIWDSGDIHSLAEFCTPEMTRELSHQIAARKGAENHTEVVNLAAEWLGMNESTDDFGKPVDEVLIRFSGLIREKRDDFAENFNEIWTLHRVKGGDTGWQLAGITQA
jgi:predicted lipid-binding transport protein (Tim44 family)